MVNANLNHVSILAKDLEESTQFYTDVLGMKRVPTANFEVPVQWLQAGGTQLHLFERDIEVAPYYHFGVTVDDFESIYQRAKEDDLFDSWDDQGNASIYRLPDGVAQMYLNDPTGNLVEVDYPEIEDLDLEIVDEVVDRRDLQPQTGKAAEASLNIGSNL